MNFLNLILLFLIAVYILQGFHKGFLVSLGNTVGMGISWLIGFLFSPLLAKTISGGSLYRFLLYFTEGSARLFDQAQGNLQVAMLSSDQIHSIVGQSNLPMPFDRIMESNLNDLVFQGSANPTIASVNDYFNYTVTNVVVNIMSFLIIYCIARIVIALLINAYNFASPLPVLKKLDGLAGGGVGALRGFFGMFALMMVVPIILISAPVNIDIFSTLVENSSVATFFYKSNFLLNFISGIV